MVEANGANGARDFTLQTNPETFARLAAGASPLRLMLTGQLRIRGKRRRALRLRKLAGDLTDARHHARRRCSLDPDLLYRALPYAFDPEWTAGHRFTLEYVIEEDASGPGGQWFLNVDDGMVTTTSLAPGGVDSHLRMSHETWLRPGARRAAAERGDAPRARARAGRDVPGDARRPLDRALRGSRRRRASNASGASAQVQSRRATWGSRLNGDGREGQGDPAVDARAAGSAGS